MKLQVDSRKGATVAVQVVVSSGCLNVVRLSAEGIVTYGVVDLVSMAVDRVWNVNCHSYPIYPIHPSATSDRPQYSLFVYRNICASKFRGNIDRRRSLMQTSLRRKISHKCWMLAE